MGCLYNGQCYSCGGRGHKSADCNSKGKGKGAVFMGDCFTCDKSGHRVNDRTCSTKGNKFRGGRKTERANEAVENHHGADAWCMMDGEMNGNDGKMETAAVASEFDSALWLMDPANTVHIVVNEEKATVEDVHAHREQRLPGSGSKVDRPAKIFKRGTAMVRVTDSHKGVMHVFKMRDTAFVPSYQRRMLSFRRMETARHGLHFDGKDSRFLLIDGKHRIDLVVRHGLYCLRCEMARRLHEHAKRGVCDGEDVA